MKNNEKICIKTCTCYYLDDIIKFEDFDFDNFLIDKKSHENIFIYDISNFDGPKPLCIRFNEIYGFIRI